MSSANLAKRKEEIFDPVLEEIITFFVVNVQKIRDDKIIRSTRTTVKESVRELINPRIIEFIMDEKATFNPNSGRIGRRLYKVEDRTSFALKTLINEYYQDRPLKKKFVRQKKIACARYLEAIVNSDPFYSKVML